MNMIDLKNRKEARREAEMMERGSVELWLSTMDLGLPQVAQW